MTAAGNVALINNTIFDFVRLGVNIDSSFSISVIGNIIAVVRQRDV